MRVRRLIDRYNQVAETYIGKKNRFSRIKYFIDYFGAYIMHGASFNDYFGYKFYNLNRKGRKKFITFRRTRKLQGKCNNKASIDDFRDKIKFNTLYSDYLGRKWLNVSASTLEDFSKFIEASGDKIFVKDVEGLCGIGVECFKTKDIDPEILYNQLQSNKKTRFILEEPLLQKGPIAELHPWSINTVRITTVLDYDNKVNIMGAVMRIGTGHDHRDNLHAGGIAAHVDLESGIVFLPGFDKSNHTYIYHPDTKKQIVGFQVPDWDKCKEFICKVAKIDPKVRYVGWDVVIKGDGTFALIEGNDNGDHDVQQLNYKGLWQDYKKVLNIK